MDLPLIWFVLVGVLFTGYAILDGFDLGVGVLSLFAQNGDERRLHMNAIGPVWDGNEVWLITGGGALFAAFPPVYATVFEGFYLALMLVLLGLIGRAVALEFRGKVESNAWRRLWDVVFGVSSLVVALLFGVALGNILRGVPINAEYQFVGSFFGLLNPYSLVVGITGLALLTAHGALWMALKSEAALAARMRRWALGGFLAFLVFYLVTYGWTWRHYATLAAVYDSVSAPALAFPVFGVLQFITLAALAWLIVLEKDHAAFLASCALIAEAMLLVLFCLHPRIVLSSVDPAHSLTIANSSSSALTLKTMLIIALIGMPLVIIYQALVYRVFKGEVQLSEESY